MSLDKPSKPEDDFFAAEEVEAKRKLAFHQGQLLAQQQREALKKQHFMKCPKCGFDLHALDEGQLRLDTCFNCHGVWMDAGELTKVKAQAAQQHRKTPLVDSILNLFKHD
ncbi:MAG: zf-TFIIB domain-containing protein [Myxococcaceae bacterium]